MKENRNKRITIRFTDAEYQRLQKLYRKSTCSQLVAYCRKVLDAKPVTLFYRNKSLDDFMVELIKIRKDFNAVGNNFNQIVKKINSVKDQSLTEVWLPYAKTLQLELIERMKNIQEKIKQVSEKWLQ